MIKVIFIHVVALSLTLVSCTSQAREIEVDFPTSSGDQHILRITIDNCTTLFKIETKDLLKINNDEILQNFMQKAVEHSKTGCR